MHETGSGEVRLDESGAVMGSPETNGVYHPAPPLPVPPDEVAARRGDVDAKQEQVGRVIEAMECEAALLLMPSHVAWFTAGMNVRGLIADSERPGVYTNGKQRWLLCSNIDTHRLFDEELDQLGFQLKEWVWESGRADLLFNVTTGRKVAGDRPFPNIPLLNDRLRPLLRVLSPYEQESFRSLGRLTAHAVEATARALRRGQTEEEIAGQLGHRLLHHGAEVETISITADGRGAKFRRAGFTSTPVTENCIFQLTAQRDGLFATASRAVTLGTPSDQFRKGFDRALRLSAIYRSMSLPGQTMHSARADEPAVLAGTTHEYDMRFSQPGYGTGRFPAEELRRGGQDEKFAAGQAIVWQPRVGPAAVVDTILVGDGGGESVTPPTEWPFKRVHIRGHSFDIPDILVLPG
jgi:Xaa-Pro aminopeptidase